MKKEELVTKLKKLLSEVEVSIPETATIRIENQFGDKLNDIVIENMLSNPNEVILSLKEEWQ